MAVITFNKKQFERDFGKLHEDMQNKIAMFGTPVELIKKDEFCLETVSYTHLTLPTTPYV